MTQAIERIPFGKTGHKSSRAIFGAAALGAMKQDRADRTLELIQQWGLNHIDVAASYGEAELRLAPWLKAQSRFSVSCLKDWPPDLRKSQATNSCFSKEDAGRPD